jgi:hypothetical protein
MTSCVPSRSIICCAQAWGDAAFPTRYFVSYDNVTDAFAFGWRFEAASGGQ